MINLMNAAKECRPMASSTSIAIALACSFGLTSVATCAAAPRLLPGVSPSVRPSAEPFGLFAFPLSDSPLKQKWLALGHELAVDRVQLALCESDRTGCASSSAVEFLAIID